MSKQTAPLLSVGMIFRDDVHYIERCLKSLAPLREAIPCELVMADTGSVDGSRAIAERYADLVIDFLWCNDFSAARNAGLERCTGEWFLFLDTDEWFDADVSALVDFLTHPDRWKENAYSVAVRNYLSVRNADHYMEQPLPRLARRQKGLCFHGLIHEALCLERGGTFVSIGQFPPLHGVLLHHDGYAQDREADLVKRKQARNLPLLRKTLEQDPDDLRTLYQCLQSTAGTDEALDYARRMVARIAANPREDVAMFPAVYQASLQAAYIAGEKELFFNWLEDAQRRLPQSMLLRVDGNGYALLLTYKLGDFSRCVEYGNRWRDALAAKDRGEGKDYVERAFSGFLLESVFLRLGLGVRVLDAALLSENWEQAQAWVDFLAEQTPNEEYTGTLTDLLLRHCRRLTVSPCLTAIWTKCLVRCASEDKRISDSGHISLGLFLETVAALPPVSRAAWRALAAMGGCDPGRAARILLAETAAEAEAELSAVENWDHIAYPAIGRLMELSLPLPEVFFARPAEALETIAGRLAERRDFAALLLRSGAPDASAPLPVLAWWVDLTAAALYHSAWQADGEGLALTRLFARLERQLLDRLYRADALDGGSLCVLPAVHRFGWRLLRAMDALEHGEAREYLRQLKAAAEDVPAVKQTAVFLLDHMDALRPAPPELLALAEQVKAILRQYPADDPAVQELKSSPVYRQVAYLIEE